MELYLQDPAIQLKIRKAMILVVLITGIVVSLHSFIRHKPAIPSKVPKGMSSILK